MYTRHIHKYVCMHTCIYIYIYIFYVIYYIYYILYIHIIYYIIYILYIYIKYTYMYIYVYMYVCCWYFGWLFPLDQSFLLRSIARLPYGLPYVYFIYSVSSPIPPIFPLPRSSILLWLFFRELARDCVSDRTSHAKCSMFCLFQSQEFRMNTHDWSIRHTELASGSARSSSFEKISMFLESRPISNKVYNQLNHCTIIRFRIIHSKFNFFNT